MTLVDQDHIRWKSWKVIARTISPLPSLFAIRQLTGEHGEIWRRLEVVWGKSAVLEHKSDNISETRDDKGKVTVVAEFGDSRRFRRYPAAYREQNSNGLQCSDVLTSIGCRQRSAISGRTLYERTTFGPSACS